jgi:hypothetical protein
MACMLSLAQNLLSIGGPMPFPCPTPIYHITHWRNLPGIIASEGLFSYAALKKEKIPYHDIANDDIQDKRARRPVPCEPGGSLHDYVPFYFAPRSPMLYFINLGGSRYPERQGPVAHLVSSVQAVYGNRPAVFTNGHAIMALSDFFTDPADLEKIDWDVMASRYWTDTQQHPGRKRRRQAEFLVHYHFPWSLVSEIAVCSRVVRSEVQALLKDTPHKPVVAVRPGWYY